MKNLIDYGWNTFFSDQLNENANNDFIPGRILTENKNNFSIITDSNEVLGELSGRLLFNDDKTEMPKVGDWVLLQRFDDDKAIIHEVLNRKTKISRKVPGSTAEEQIIITNVDVIFIVQSLDENFNLNRLERYLVTVFESKAEPVILLSKADLCENFNEKYELLKNTFPEIKTIVISSYENLGISELEEILEPSKTYAFLGSSGVGKSTIINKLVGNEIQKTTEVRESDSRGKHTTTKRELILLPGKGILIDTPGMRGLKLWSSDEGINKTFGGFEEYQDSCKYKNCTHLHEGGCSILEAVENGEIDQARYDNYLKLQKELKYLETKIDHKAMLEEKKKWKEIQKWYRNNFNDKKRS